MERVPEIDGVTAERLLNGASVAGDDLAPVAALFVELRAIANASPAPLSAPLAAVLRDGLPGGPPSVSAAVRVPASSPLLSRRPPRWRRMVAGAGVGFALLGGGMTVAAAHELLPDGLNRTVNKLVESLIPFDLENLGRPDPARPGGGHVPPGAGATRPAGDSPGSGRASTSVPGTGGTRSNPPGGARSSPSSPVTTQRGPAADRDAPGAPTTVPGRPAGTVTTQLTVPPHFTLPTTPPATTPSTSIPVTTPSTTLPPLPLR